MLTSVMIHPLRIINIFLPLLPLSLQHYIMSLAFPIFPLIYKSTNRAAMPPRAISATSEPSFCAAPVTCSTPVVVAVEFDAAVGEGVE